MSKLYRINGHNQGEIQLLSLSLNHLDYQRLIQQMGQLA